MRSPSLKIQNPTYMQAEGRREIFEGNPSRSPARRYLNRREVSQPALPRDMKDGKGGVEQSQPSHQSAPFMFGSRLSVTTRSKRP
jgi:hypothetical protein